jgi:YD repeat-containing protein
VIKDGSGNPVSRTKSFYDEYSTTAYQLLTYSDLGTTTYTDPGSSGSGATKRANATTMRRCLDVSDSCATYLETHARYDQTGNIVAAWNERGIETDTEYAIDDGAGHYYCHTYPTKVTTAVPDSSGNHGSSSAFMATTVYDPVTGLVKSSTDANGLTSTISYADDSSVLDPLLRPRKVTAPNGAWTKTYYHDDLSSCGTPGTDSCLYVKTQTLMDTGRVSESYAFFDQLGRAVRSQSSLGSAGYLTVDTAFDGYGRAHTTSNPYTTTLGGTISTSVPQTEITGYDALSRVTQVKLPDNTTVNTSYSGIYTTVTDQAGRSRRQKVDALGRIVRVDEADPAHSGALDSGASGSIDSPYMASYYTYDTLGNLIRIQQGQGTDLQYRYFKYDALGRLTYERQPEANGTFPVTDSLSGNNYWSRKLVYDETIDSVSYEGLLTTMCDAREICSETKYDQLNRPWEVNHPDSRQPTVTTHYDLGYDTDHATRGQVTEILTSEVPDDTTGTSWDDSIPATRLGYTYDQWGRMSQSSQGLIWDTGHYVHTFDFKYQYNVGGQMTQEEYPSHRLVNFGYDDASRLSNVNGGAGHVYVDAFTYTGQGLAPPYPLGNGGAPRQAQDEAESDQHA